MTEISPGLPAADADTMMPCDGEAPALPVRTPIKTRTSATAHRLWRESECRDRATFEHIATALRNLDTDRSYRPQDEVDGVIARWRAARAGGSRI